MKADEMPGLIEITVQAIEEADVDRFVELLMERNRTIESRLRSGVKLDPSEAEVLYHKEDQILKRLKEERTKVLIDMESLSGKGKAAKKYSSKFSLPPMPVFFDRNG
jgi:hypothetical protein